MNYYDKKGKPITVEEWAKLLNNFDYKIIKRDDVGSYWVSTVWLGLDHSFAKESLAPLIFETMAFKKKDDGTREWSGETMIRSSTLNEALMAHKEVCNSIITNKSL